MMRALQSYFSYMGKEIENRGQYPKAFKRTFGRKEISPHRPIVYTSAFYTSTYLPFCRKEVFSGAAVISSVRSIQ